jgi:hypothetical protein
MAPSTRKTNRIATPSRREKPGEADTPKKSALYHAYDTRDASESIRSLASRFEITHPTALNWLHDREINGSPAYRHKRRRSDKLGRRSRVSAETCKMLVSPSRNAVRTQPLEVQIAYHGITVKRRALRTINWHAKAEKLYFYHDEEEYTIKPKAPRKPRRLKKDTDESYALKIIEWDAQKSHAKDVRPQGNAMTQEYYTNTLLPNYIKAIINLRDGNDPWAHPWLLMEDGDPSHGMRKPGLAHYLKAKDWIPNLMHPAQSPDLNPMEAVWNILKQRMRKRVWETEEELREVLQDEWSKITIEEVRRRIADMPRRCKLLVKTDGKPIKTARW